MAAGPVTGGHANDVPQLTYTYTPPPQRGVDLEGPQTDFPSRSSLAWLVASAAMRSTLLTVMVPAVKKKKDRRRMPCYYLTRYYLCMADASAK